MNPFRHLLLLISLCSYATAFAQTATLTRGPYLQVVTPTSVIVRWRTDLPTDSRVAFGTRAGQLAQQALASSLTTEHIVQLSGLQPTTKYYYSIGSTAVVLSADTAQNVRTAPLAGSTGPIRFWALGDFGSDTPNQYAVRDQLVKATANRRPDIWLWLGDNAYNGGSDAEYGQKVFTVYPTLFRNIPVFPSPGNHDYADNIDAMVIDYYKIFSMPTKAEAGGLASGTSAYYSYDYGNVHFISLDSYGNEAGKFRLSDTTGTQVQWLKRDLTANKLPWKVVYFHHPPHTKGSHNSDTEAELVLIRQNLTPILERYGVDLVLNGHSHVYERSYRMKGHTGLANTFGKRTNATDSTTFVYNGSANSCPVLSQGVGTVYAVAGSGGQLGGRADGYPHPAMIYNNTTVGGSLIIDVNDNRLDAQWIAADGTVPDRFTMLKNVNKTTALTIEYADTVQLRASWPGEFRWTGGQTSRAIQYIGSQPGVNQVSVSDPQHCLNDLFSVTVLPKPRVTARLTSGSSYCPGSVIAVTATPENTTKAAGWQYDVLLSDAAGSFINPISIGSGTINALTAKLPATLLAGTGYKLTVRPRGIAYAETVASAAFGVLPLPTATLTGSATVTQGQPVSLNIGLTGNGPWRGSLSDGTSFSATATPAVVVVTPVKSGVYSLTSVENNCGKGTVSGQAVITVLQPTATEATIDRYLRVYPNPAHDHVRVELTLAKKETINIGLKDAQGRVIYQKQLGAVLTVGETVSLPAPPGIYLVTVQVGDAQLVRKVVRQ